MLLWTVVNLTWAERTLAHLGIAGRANVTMLSVWPRSAVVPDCAGEPPTYANWGVTTAAKISVIQGM